jgi:hypothetical protein
LPTTEILQTDVLGSVVVRVVLVPTLLTLERLLVAIVVVGNPHVEHRFDVLRGSTCTVSIPCSSALYRL